MYGISLKVWGKYALFCRPEMKAERVSYDVITPSAARGILEAVHYKPALRWRVDEIHVLKPIRFTNVRRNEVSEVVAARNVLSAIKKGTGRLRLNPSQCRQQRAALMLKDVAYIIKAHFELTDRAGETDTPEKHYNIFLRRARRGQCFYQPYLGCREFAADFALVEPDEDGGAPIAETKDLGYMLYDIDFRRGMQPVFFRAQMNDGVIKMPEELKGRVNR